MGLFLLCCHRTLFRVGPPPILSRHFSPSPLALFLICGAPQFWRTAETHHTLLLSPAPPLIWAQRPHVSCQDFTVRKLPPAENAKILCRPFWGRRGIQAAEKTAAPAGCERRPAFPPLSWRSRAPAGSGTAAAEHFGSCWRLYAHSDRTSPHTHDLLTCAARRKRDECVGGNAALSPKAPQQGSGSRHLRHWASGAVILVPMCRCARLLPAPHLSDQPWAARSAQSRSLTTPSPARPWRR